MPGGRQTKPNGVRAFAKQVAPPPWCAAGHKLSDTGHTRPTTVRAKMGHNPNDPDNVQPSQPKAAKAFPHLGEPWWRSFNLDITAARPPPQRPPRLHAPFSLAALPPTRTTTGLPTVCTSVTSCCSRCCSSCSRSLRLSVAVPRASRRGAFRPRPVPSTTAVAATALSPSLRPKPDELTVHAEDDGDDDDDDKGSCRVNGTPEGGGGGAWWCLCCR